MEKKIVVLFVFCVLMVSGVGISTTGDVNLDQRQDGDGCPQDFDFLGVTGGFHPKTILMKLHINSDGEATYSKLYPEDRSTGEWTVISQFDFTEEEMDQIWDAITSNEFFNLQSFYQDTNVRDGTYAEVTITGGGKTHTVRTENIPVRKFDAIVEFINSLTPGDNDLYYNALVNKQPDRPSRPSGETSGKVGKEYTYTTQTTDYNFDQIYYRFSWGDGTDSGWIGPYESGEMCSAKHTWSSRGYYNITVQAKDDPNGDGDLSDGFESLVSEPLPVSMPKMKSSKLIFFGLLEKLIQKLPVFKFLQRFHNVFSPTITLTTSNAAGGTRVSRKDCNITVDIYIQIRGPCATVQVTKDIEKNIEDVWNAGNWKVKCEEGCDPREPGCNVKFDAHVVRMPAGEFLPGFHDITIVCDNSADGNGHVSEVMVRDSCNAPPPCPDRVLDQPRPNDGTTATGTWDTNEPANTYAHEAGHLMGLDDTYPPYQNEADFNNHIMDDNGLVTQDDIDLIIGMSGVECPCECCPEEEDETEPEVDIFSPEDGASVTSPINVTGEATDYGGSGVAELDYELEWDGGSYEGDSIYIDPPVEKQGFILGPIYLEDYIEIGDWIAITIFAVDAAGNIGSDTVTVIWEEEEDTTPPVTEKTVGEPNEEGGYIIWPYTPITLEATDDMSGVNHIHYEIWWDSDDNGIVDTQMADETVYSSTTTFTVGDYEIYYGLIELRWYAVDNAQNTEEMHYQEHFVYME